MEVCKVHRGETSRPRAGSLKEAVEDTKPWRVQACDCRIFQLKSSQQSSDSERTQSETYIQDDEEDDVEAIEYHEDPKQPPSRCRREEEGEATPRVIK